MVDRLKGYMYSAHKYNELCPLLGENRKKIDMKPIITYVAAIMILINMQAIAQTDNIKISMSEGEKVWVGIKVK